MIHKIRCSVCGRRGAVDLERYNKSFSSNKALDWNYFSNICTNFMEVDKYFYQIVSIKPKLVTKRVKNKSYDPEAKPKFAEYWECKKCYLN